MRFFKILFIFVFVGLVQEAFAQEALKSTEEEYYDFLSLIGITERPTLNFRTLSDSEWNIKEESENKNSEKSVSESVLKKETDSANETSGVLVHPWQNNNLGRKFTLWEKQEKSENWFAHGINQDIKLKLYGPEWFNSYNTAAPYGQNDGALWQGKGYNTSITAGARLEAYGFELTVKPQISFSENREFEIMPSAYDSEYGYFWGYGNNKGADAPQRFGDSSFWTYDWSDTEARWTWHTFTVGFGFQSPWLGPAWLNPMLGSNNAPTYPKFDIGLRKTQIRLPWLGWYIGDIEGRVWTGYLTESDYFDNDDSNDHNMIHGFSFAYSPSFLKGLTIGANRICLVKWDWENLKYVFPKVENTHVGEQGAGEDQKMSITVDWLFPKVGFEVYGELGLDDGTPFSNYLRSAIHMVGLKKSITISKKYSLYGEIIYEWSNSEMTQDFQYQWPYSFGFHYQITQGFTNKGQWLGYGLGYGGECRMFAFKLYHKYGYIYFRSEYDNIDLNYAYSGAINTINAEMPYRRYYWIIGIENMNFLTKNLSVTETFIYNDIRHFLYKEHTSLDNFTFRLTLKYNL